MRQISDFDIRLLRVFMTVAECGSFVAAQAILNNAASTLSEQIKDLELRVGFSICVRGRRGFKLTAQGEQLYATAKEMFASLEEARTRVNQIGGRSIGALTIGIVDSTISDPHLDLPEVLLRFAREKPDVRVGIVIEPPPRLETGLIDGRIDIAVGPFALPDKGLVYQQLYVERQVLCCGKDHPLFARPEKATTDAMLQDALFVAAEYPTQSAVAFKPRAMVANIEALALLVLSGLYIGFLPAHVAAQWIGMGRMRKISEDRFAYDAAFSTAMRKTSVEDPALRAFIRHLGAKANVKLVQRLIPV
jgi:LysR family transcriptional regulator, transcriptional activator for bauABCD operon